MLPTKQEVDNHLAAVARTEAAQGWTYAEHSDWWRMVDRLPEEAREQFRYILSSRIPKATMGPGLNEAMGTEVEDPVWECRYRQDVLFLVRLVALLAPPAAGGELGE